MAFKKHIIPKVTMQQTKPKYSKNIANTVPSINKIIHMEDTANARHVCRICNQNY